MKGTIIGNRISTGFGTTDLIVTFNTGAAKAITFKKGLAPRLFIEG